VVLTADTNDDCHLPAGASLPSEVFLGAGGRSLDEFYAVEDLRQIADPSYVELKLIDEGLRSCVSIPLKADGQFIGLLSLGAYEPGAFGEEHLPIAREVADLLAIATRQAQLYRQLQRTNADLQEALQARDEMIQNVSHELRTPLFLIKGYVEIMLEGMMGQLSEEQHGALEVMEHQGKRLSHMLDQLLTLKKVGADQLDRQPIDVGAFIEQVMDDWKTVAATNGVSLSFEPATELPLLLVDANLLGLVLYNLLDNAIKFSPKGGPVTVRAWAEQDQVVIVVADKGIGIPADKLERVFNRFYQVSQGLHRGFEGMGVGLALCRDIVLAHGGRIWLESAGVGQGSTFYVVLPLNGNQGSVASQQGPSCGREGGCT
jgi:signal transduction histidine kinase